MLTQLLYWVVMPGDVIAMSGHTAACMCVNQFKPTRIMFCCSTYQVWLCQSREWFHHRKVWVTEICCVVTNHRGIFPWYTQSVICVAKSDHHE